MHFAMSPDSLLLFYAVAAAVTAAFGLFSLYRHLARRRRNHSGMEALDGDPEERRPLAVTTAASSLLPPFMYNRLVRHSGKGNGAGSTECAVCLGTIRVGAMAKLLPACAHVYHVECIDLWLASHSTCPLCRCRVGDDRSAQDLAYLSPA
ncbi:RING-H2 finger protein ATL60 [Hordeum vulgare]|uniref:RING-type E3 ubiquitin transferase n=1 Tax=Hordeum vulgare subsp. vulgare TaxID=112509 RepID=M0YZY3_HORVV|nr:RING-H2 finger protein ATL39-like [Hordeum vulgare subsp. vulgare]KAE8796112.1 RING-H2 finger protein ATL60 [Hordeum vulgare]